MKKRLLTIVLAVSIPCMLLFVVVQSARHYTVVAELRTLERQQAGLVEGNRKLLSALAQAAARRRIDQQIQEDGTFRSVGPANTLRIQVRPEKGNIDG